MAELKMDFPSNSKERRSEEPKKKVTKVVTGSVEVRKKSALQTFFGDDLENVGSYILNDVVIPALKNTISEVVGNGIDMLLFGSTYSGSGRRRGRSSYVTYSSFGSRYGKERDRDDRERSYQRTGRDRGRDLESVIFDTRSDAEEVLSQLVDFVVDYGEATVADFYDLAGISGEFTDNKYGWESLDGARVERDTFGGYHIRFPRVRPL